jgi:hypothetical protein
VLLKEGREGLVFQQIYRFVLLGTKNLDLPKSVWIKIGRDYSLAFSILTLVFFFAFQVQEIAPLCYGLTDLIAHHWTAPIFRKTAGGQARQLYPWRDFST